MSSEIKTFPAALRLAVATAEPIISDGESDVPVTDLNLAREALRGNPSTFQIEGLANVVALGVEYWLNIDTDDPDELAALAHLGVRSPDDTVDVVRWWCRQGGPLI